MSHLPQAIVRDELLAIILESQLRTHLAEEAHNSHSKPADDDWDHLWTDVGGEA